MSAESKAESIPDPRGDASNAEAEAFRSGALEGWNRAWTDHYKAPFAAGEEAADQQASAHAVEEAPSFELSDEWAAFFARSAARRKQALTEEAEEARAQEDEEREREEEDVPLFLGGARDAASRIRAEKLYGSRAEEVLLAEARLDAVFQAEISAHRAVAWPALPLTSWKPRKAASKRKRDE